MKVYILMCEIWTGTHNATEIVEAFKDEELAHRTALLRQGNTPTCDVRYFVEAVEFNDLEV